VRWRSELDATVEDAALGCHSTAELKYLRDVERAHGLPTGNRQRPRRRRGGRWYDDVCYDDYRTIVEIDGPAAHPLERDARDAERDNAAVLDGYDVLRIDVARLARPCLRAVEVTTVLWRNSWTGLPVPCGPGCAVNALIRKRQ
jgi:very-short-patch-repair endonuclease